MGGIASQNLRQKIVGADAVGQAGRTEELEVVGTSGLDDDGTAVQLEELGL